MLQKGCMDIDFWSQIYFQKNAKWFFPISWKKCEWLKSTSCSNSTSVSLHFVVASLFFVSIWSPRDFFKARWSFSYSKRKCSKDLSPMSSYNHGSFGRSNCAPKKNIYDHRDHDYYMDDSLGIFHLQVVLWRKSSTNIYGGVSKNRGVSPKMDGENHGKPYFLMDDFGGKTHYFRKHPHSTTIIVIDVQRS